MWKAHQMPLLLEMVRVHTLLHFYGLKAIACMQECSIYTEAIITHVPVISVQCCR